MDTENSIFEGLKYIIRFPLEYSQEKQYPVLLFLHGAGTRGDDIQLLKDNPFFVITEKFSDFPFITIAPLCNANTWFDVFETLKRLVIHIMDLKFVDTDKVYLMGASMGGYATWQLAMSLPECFSAIIPICGGGMYWNAERLIDIPIWAFHGQMDNVVSVEESKKMVDSVNNIGGNAQLTIYPENGHDAWSNTYNNEAIYKWLLTNKKNKTKELSDNYHDSNLFG